MDRTILLALLITCFSVTSAQLLGGAENIDDLTEPAVVAAANAAVQYLNRQNPSNSRELILVRIISGTQQVINGVRYSLNIEVAPAQTCLNDNNTSTIEQCPVDINSANTWVIMVVASSGPPVIHTVESATMVTNVPLPGGRTSIDDFSDPLVIGAACAAVDQITTISNSKYKSVFVLIANGTKQVVNGFKYDLLMVVALSTTCERDSELCTSADCPIDERTKYLWMASVVAPPTPVNMTINYMVLNVSRVMHIGQGGGGGGGMKMPLQNFSDPKVMGAACAAVDQITEMSNSVYKSVLVTIISGTYQVVNGLRYDMLIEVALSTTCTRDSNLCTSVECPIDERTQMQWMVSVVAPPTPQNNYDVVSVAPVIEDSGGVVMSYQLFTIVAPIICVIFGFFT